MTIFEKVSAALATLNPAVPFGMDVFIGSLPETYIVYFLVTDNPELHADNAETNRSHHIQISIYSHGGLVSLPDVDTAMLAAGFQKGQRLKLPYSADTQHYGIAIDYFYHLDL